MTRVSIFLITTTAAAVVITFSGLLRLKWRLTASGKLQAVHTATESRRRSRITAESTRGRNTSHMTAKMMMTITTTHQRRPLLLRFTRRATSARSGAAADVAHLRQRTQTIFSRSHSLISLTGSPLRTSQDWTTRSFSLWRSAGLNTNRCRSSDPIIWNSTSISQRDERNWHSISSTNPLLHRTPSLHTRS